MMVYKVTLDGGLLTQAVLLPAVKTLKAWEAEGKIEIFESDRPKQDDSGNHWPGATKVPTFAMKRSRVARKNEPGGVSFQRISAVLFPMRDPNRLNMHEINDVAHLVRHHSAGRSMFITNNTRNFIDEGKREQLESAFKIVILTPDEAVTVLRKLGDWKEPTQPEDDLKSLKRGVR